MIDLWASAGQIIVIYVFFHLRKKRLFRGRDTVSGIIAAWETRLTENGISPEPNLCIVRLISEIKAYIHPKSFCTSTRSVRCILQRKKRLREELKNITPPSIRQLEKRTSSRATDVV